MTTAFPWLTWLWLTAACIAIPTAAALIGSRPLRPRP